MAIGTRRAALCLREYLRTKNFVKGLMDAIDDELKTSAGPIVVCYAGTGPFATLALPVMASYTPAEVQFILMEVNEASHQMMKQVIQNLGMAAYVREYLQEDASTVKLSHAKDIDILVTETMQRALYKEQQVAITLNLMSQLREDTILIPEKIQLDLVLLNHDAFRLRTDGTPESGYCRRLGNLFSISKLDIDKHQYKPKLERTEAKLTEVPIDLQANYSDLAIFTEIQVYGNTVLTLNQCSLTTPLYLHRLHQDSEHLMFYSWYQVAGQPSIHYHIGRKREKATAPNLSADQVV